MEISRELALELYRKMRLIRRFEERVVELVNANEIPGITHEYIGQEAVAAGVCAALRPDDAITSTHRGHGHVIAKGGDIRYMMAELMGRETGYNRGRGGSMHIADVRLGVYGANGIVGAGCPMACGAAYVFRQQGDRVVVAFFGDGAINQGVVQESLNLAAILDLPVVFVCENNLYAITTPLHSVTRNEPWRRAEAYGMPARAVDGMDVEAVYGAAVEAVARARAGKGPSFLECRTYRYSGHYTAERNLPHVRYRTEEEIEAWRQRDPIRTWRQRILERGLAVEAELAEVDAEIERALEEAVAFARESPWPDPATALAYMYAEPMEGIPARGWR